MPIPMSAWQPYPSRAKNVVWQKFKKFKDKVNPNTKTGLGDSLKAAEKAWGLIKWDVIDIKKRKAANLKAAQDNLTKAKAMLQIVDDAKEAIKKAQTKADATKTNTSLSKGALGQVDVIIASLKHGLDNLNKITDIEDEFEAEVKRNGG